MSDDDAMIEEIRRVLAEAQNAIDPFAYAFELSDISLLLSTIDRLTSDYRKALELFPCGHPKLHGVVDERSTEPWCQVCNLQAELARVTGELEKRKHSIPLSDIEGLAEKCYVQENRRLRERVRLYFDERDKVMLEALTDEPDDTAYRAAERDLRALLEPKDAKQ